MEERLPLFLDTNWKTTEDGFAMYTVPMADILAGMGIRHTGLSSLNPRDVYSYYDDWYLYRVSRDRTVYSLLKMREQEHDYVPGYADMDDPGVTISFVAFDPALLMALWDCPDEAAMAAFVKAFRRTTEFLNEAFDPQLQQYFADESAKAPYLVANAYIDKLLTMASNGCVAFPEKMAQAPERVLRGLEMLNAQAGRAICDFKARCIRIGDVAASTREERICLLATHTGNLSLNSFAAEVKFHADALVSWQNKIPIWGKSQWYASALRADMQLEEEEWLRKTWFSPYYSDDDQMVRRQAEIHGAQ